MARWFRNSLPDRAGIGFMRIVFCVVAACLAGAAFAGSIVISGNEGKIDLTPGTATLIPNAEPDTVSILDFGTFPPKVTHLTNVPNTVIGPPSNIAISPDGKLGLIADSLKVDPANSTNLVPNNRIHLLDLSVSPPRVVGEVTGVGEQPSGMSFTPDGRKVLVANRAEGTISTLEVNGMKVRLAGKTGVCKPEESISDVAISPDGKLALASAQKGGYLAVLRIERDTVDFTGQKISVYGQPYRVVITPDGELAITAGQGFGNGLDPDLVTIVDLTSEPIRTADFLKIGTGPETVELSPDGQLLAVLTMSGSNLAPGNPQLTKSGGLELFRRSGKTFEKLEVIPTGAIPEGAAFTSDGKHLVVQCHPARELWVYSVAGGRVGDEPLRIPVPGMPSSLRASP